MLFSTVVAAFIFITGAVIGSFLNVVILRTVSGESIVFPPSKCPKCQTPLKWYHNIPILSYLFLRGKCAFCKEHISFQYPIVELLTGLLFVGLFLRFCNPFDAFFGLAVMNPISWSQIIVYMYSLTVACLFISIAGTDITEQKVSDAHTIPLIVIGLLYGIAYSIFNIVLYVKELGMPKIDLEFFLTCPILFSLAAGICGFLIMEAISRLGLVTVGTRAFGEGDSYIAAGFGTVFGSLYGCSAMYNSFLPIFKILVAILALSGILQILFTIPLFVKKLICEKNFLTLGMLAAFTIFACGYFFANSAGLLSNTAVYWTMTIVLVALGLEICRELIVSLKKSEGKDGLYLPFGPAMIVAAFIALFVIPF